MKPGWLPSRPRRWCPPVERISILLGIDLCLLRSLWYKRENWYLVPPQAKPSIPKPAVDVIWSKPIICWNFEKEYLMHAEVLLTGEDWFTPLTQPNHFICHPKVPWWRTGQKKTEEVRRKARNVLPSWSREGKTFIKHCWNKIFFFLK